MRQGDEIYFVIAIALSTLMAYVRHDQNGDFSLNFRILPRWLLIMLAMQYQIVIWIIH